MPQKGAVTVKILITVPWDQTQFLRLTQAFPQVEFHTALTEDQVLQAVGDAEVVFGDLSRSAFLKAEKLRWIQCHGAGVNKLVAIPELVSSSIPVTNTSGAHAPTIAEHFFGGLIALTRKLPELYLAKQRREWANWSKWADQFGSLPVSLVGMTMGVVGLGNIGRAIAERAAAFQMRVIAVDICDVPHPAYLDGLWKIDQLPKLLQQSDVVVVTVPGTPETANLLSKEMLLLMKPTAYLGVVSRGGIVDEEAVAGMLIEGRLAGAVMDVFQKEPLPTQSRLWDAPNLMLTPHVSGKSEQTTAAATAIFIENLENYLAGKPLRNVIKKELGF
jgi:phosphoglycerate dehydrogenase-like enzyme